MPTVSSGVLGAGSLMPNDAFRNLSTSSWCVPSTDILSRLSRAFTWNTRSFSIGTAEFLVVELVVDPAEELVLEFNEELSELELMGVFMWCAAVDPLHSANFDAGAQMHQLGWPDYCYQSIGHPTARVGTVGTAWWMLMMEFHGG